MNHTEERNVRTEPVSDREARVVDWTELKLALNNAIWMHAPEDTTLGDAEHASRLAISHLCKGYNDRIAGNTGAEGPAEQIRYEGRRLTK